MHVPYDTSLDAWIRKLIECGRLYRFYKTAEWLSLRDHVLRSSHHECELCREQGAYSKAVTVHHVNEVKDRPDLALSLWYTDASTGDARRNLIALCARCHNRIHKRFQGSASKASESPLTEERW